MRNVGNVRQRLVVAGGLARYCRLPDVPVEQRKRPDTHLQPNDFVLVSCIDDDGVLPFRRYR